MSDAAAAYVVSVLIEQADPNENVVVKDSAVMTYARAVERCDFNLFQGLGDGLLWLGSAYPTAFEKHSTTYSFIGKKSYSTCHRLLNGSWPLYEELADNFVPIVSMVNTTVFSSSVIP